MNSISCNVCMDLMPLVKDGIASEDSCILVREHLTGCEQCALAFGESTKPDLVMDDTAVLGKIKKQVTLFLMGSILAGTLLGLVLADGMGMFYNALIMPAIGGFGYLLLKRKAYLVPLGLLLFSSVWTSIREAVRGMLTYASTTEWILSSVWWSVIFAAFSGLGVLIAWLLHYAFRKEGKNE